MRILYLAIFCLAAVTAVHAQDSTARQLQQLPDKYFSQVSGKSRHFEKQVSKRSQKALERLARPRSSKSRNCQL